LPSKITQVVPPSSPADLAFHITRAGGAAPVKALVELREAAADVASTASASATIENAVAVHDSQQAGGAGIQ
jgi:hypothetical protein